MRKLFIYGSFAILLSFCTKPKPKQYKVTISSNGYVTSTDYIKAYDDTNAYFQGVKSWFATKKVERMILHRVKSDAFIVTDEQGIDLTVKLSKKVVDSCNKIWVLVLKEPIY